MRDIYCGSEVLFETCVAIKFVMILLSGGKFKVDASTDPFMLLLFALSYCASLRDYILRILDRISYKLLVGISPGPKFTDDLRTVIRQFSDLRQSYDNWQIHRTLTTIVRPILRQNITITF